MKFSQLAAIPRLGQPVAGGGRGTAFNARGATQREDPLGVPFRPGSRIFGTSLAKNEHVFDNFGQNRKIFS
jgi:hypothetical protein